MILDMHCHLDLYAEPFEVARKCQELGVFVLSVTTTPKAWKGTKKLEFENSKIRTAIGLHPQVASQRIAELDLFDEILPRTKYVGEIGLKISQILIRSNTKLSDIYYQASTSQVER